MQTDNIKAAEIACQFIADKIDHKGNVIIQNGPQVASVIDRSTGARRRSGAIPTQDSSKDQDGKGSREGGLNVMQGYLTRFDDVKGSSRSTTPRRSALIWRRNS